MRQVIWFFVFVVCLCTSSPGFAQSIIDPDASVVELRTSCISQGSTYLDNCFESTGDLETWLWGGFPPPTSRNNEPNSLDQVTVRVGPGTFDRLECDATAVPLARGFVSVIGSGREVTEFHNPVDAIDPGLANVCPGGITVRSCTGMSFLNLTASGLGSGVIWTGNGTSTWEGVDMIADNQGAPRCLSTAMAWYDVFSFDSLHFFWNTRFHTHGNGTFVLAAFNGRGESWVYGSDLLLKASGTGGGGFYASVFGGAKRGIRIFGSTVRAAADSTFGGSIAGLHARGTPSANGDIHMHGGIINVSGGFAIGVYTSTADSFIHTPDTAFNLSTVPGGLKARIIAFPGSDIQSPFLWPASTTAPDILSQNGSDLFVKTDEGAGANESHLYVYDNSCSPDTWRSVTTGACL